MWGEGDGREQWGVELYNSPHCPESQPLVLGLGGAGGMAVGDAELWALAELVGSCGFFLAVLTQGWHPSRA